jgi:8-oxo-dGTP diphosphatase
MDKHLAYGWITRDGRVLFIRREPGVFLGGRWELPGGTVEPGEPSPRAAVREIAEETGLAVQVLAERDRLSWPDINGKPMTIHACVYDVVEDEPGRPVVLNPGEHDEHAWLVPGQAMEFDLVGHVRRCIARGSEL